jgi:hypothetical protein
MITVTPKLYLYINTIHKNWKHSSLPNISTTLITLTNSTSPHWLHDPRPELSLNLTAHLLWLCQRLATVTHRIQTSMQPGDGMWVVDRFQVPPDVSSPGSASIWRTPQSRPLTSHGLSRRLSGKSLKSKPPLNNYTTLRIFPPVWSEIFSLIWTGQVTESWSCWILLTD